MKPKIETILIRSLDEVPPGYEQLAWFQTRVPGKRETTVGKFLSEAHATGKVPAVKLVRCFGDLKTGPVFLDRDKTVALLEEQYGVSFTLDAPAAGDDAALREVKALAVEMREAIKAMHAAAFDLRAAVELLAEQAVSTQAAKEHLNGVA
jgi:hypothetical protein